MVMVDNVRNKTMVDDVDKAKTKRLVNDEMYLKPTIIEKGVKTRDRVRRSHHH